MIINQSLWFWNVLAPRNEQHFPVELHILARIIFLRYFLETFLHCNLSIFLGIFTWQSIVFHSHWFQQFSLLKVILVHILKGVTMEYFQLNILHNSTTCASLGGRFAQEIVRAHDLGNQKLCDCFAQMNLVGRCSCSLLFVPPTSIRGNKEFFWDCLEKTSFRSWRKRDESSILN